MKHLQATFWDTNPDTLMIFNKVVGIRRLSTHSWEIRHKETGVVQELTIIAEHATFEMVNEGRCFLFDSTAEAHGDCQCRDDIKNGDMLVIPSEKVVGLAATWPVAVTLEFGDLHRSLFNGDLARLMSTSRWTQEQVNTAVSFAKRHNWPVATLFLLNEVQS